MPLVINASKVLFSSNDMGNQEIYLMNVDGTNKIKLTNTPYDEVLASASEDYAGNVLVVFKNGTDKYFSEFFCGTDPSPIFGQRCSLKAEMIAAQVIPDVDFIVGKTAVAMVKVTYNAVPTNSIVPIVKFYYNGTLIGTNSSVTMYGGNVTRFYFTFIPPTAGTNLLMRGEVLHNAEGNNRTEVLEKKVNVSQTDDLNLIFIKFDDPSDFEITVNNQSKFINATYPLKNNGLKVIKDLVSGLTTQDIISKSKDADEVVSRVSQRLDDFVFFSNLVSLYALDYRGIGVLPIGWFNNLSNYFPGSTLSGTGGITYTGTSISLIEDRGVHVSAHELAHQKDFLMCDEYNNSTWVNQSKSAI
ncbi:MAG: hypothetical protein AABY04_04585, partial [Candidatus Micrarchaeota archaeon]